MDIPLAYPRTGASLVTALEHEYWRSHVSAQCNHCLYPEFDGVLTYLRRCTGCMLVDYCSKGCQKANWKTHKRFCDMVQGRGHKNAYLSGYTQSQMKKMLIDSYRLRTWLDHIRRDENHGIYYKGDLADGVIWAKGDVSTDFQRYLDLAEDAAVLPSWWSFETRMECLVEAVDEDNKKNISSTTDHLELFHTYQRDASIHSALPILAELIVGFVSRGPPEDERWFMAYKKYLERHPEEKAKLLNHLVESNNNSTLPLGIRQRSSS